MTDRLRGSLLVAAQFALLAVLVPTGTTWAVPDVARLAGTVGRTTGAALIVLGGIRLGAAASVHPAPTTEARLRTDGAYRYARHPIYTGVLVLGAAIALTARSPSHLVAWAALPGVLSLRSRFEDGLLTERFPDYPAYMPQTRRFVPFPTRRPGPDEDRSRTQHRHRRHAPSSSGPSSPTSPPWAGGAPSPDRPRGSRQPTGPSRRPVHGDHPASPRPALDQHGHHHAVHPRAGLRLRRLSM